MTEKLLTGTLNLNTNKLFYYNSKLPFLLYVRCKFGVTFIRKCFHDAIYFSFVIRYVDADVYITSKIVFSGAIPSAECSAIFVICLFVILLLGFEGRVMVLGHCLPAFLLFK